MGLELQALGHGLDDERGVGQLSEVGGDADPVEQGRAVVLGELAAGHRTGRGALDVLLAARGGGLVHLHGDDLDAHAGEHLDDARTHRAQTDNTHPGELASHVHSPFVDNQIRTDLVRAILSWGQDPPHPSTRPRDLPLRRLYRFRR